MVDQATIEMINKAELLGTGVVLGMLIVLIVLLRSWFSLKKSNEGKHERVCSLCGDQIPLMTSKELESLGYFRITNMARDWKEYVFCKSHLRSEIFEYIQKEFQFKEE